MPNLAVFMLELTADDRENATFRSSDRVLGYWVYREMCSVEPEHRSKLVGIRWAEYTYA